MSISHLVCLIMNWEKHDITSFSSKRAHKLEILVDATECSCRRQAETLLEEGLICNGRSVKRYQWHLVSPQPRGAIDQRQHSNQKGEKQETMHWPHICLKSVHCESPLTPFGSKHRAHHHVIIFLRNESPSPVKEIWPPYEWSYNQLLFWNHGAQRWPHMHESLSSLGHLIWGVIEEK